MRAPLEDTCAGFVPVKNKRDFSDFVTLGLENVRNDDRRKCPSTSYIFAQVPDFRAIQPPHRILSDVKRAYSSVNVRSFSLVDGLRPIRLLHLNDIAKK